MLTSKFTHGMFCVIVAAVLTAPQAHAATAAHMSHAMSKPASPAPVPRPNAAERAFVADVTSALQSKFATTGEASAAGYYRMTRLEPDGTVIWFNGKWDGAVSKYEPNFLWFDKNGKLVGLDYEYLTSTNLKPPGPAVYPVMASRWTTIDPHIHFAYKKPDGTIVRRGAAVLPHVKGDPDAAELRAAKLLPANATLLWSHYHPKTWDLGFWVVPNPSGAFAELNPLVKP